MGRRGNNPIKALAPWYGAKRTIAAKIVAQLGDHTSYVEPFCGSMAVLFQKPPARHEVVNDLNRDLVNAAVCIRDSHLAPLLIGRLHFTLCSEELYRESRSHVMTPYTGDLGNVDRAYHALVTWWLGRNGMAGTRQSRTSFSARFTPRGGSGGVRFRNMIASVPAFTRRLERVDVLNRDGFEILGKLADETGTAIYLDPPYCVKAAEYEHDAPRKEAERKDWHRRLADSASRFRAARVVVSYYPHPWVDEFYPPDKWARVEVSVTKMIRNTDTRCASGQKATELLLVNGTPIETHTDVHRDGPQLPAEGSHANRTPRHRKAGAVPRS
jgi:DNA adenine methylase